MAKRFGRNQKRKLLAEITDARIASIKAAEAVELVEARRRMEVERLSEEVRAARMARNTIRIDIDSLIDERERDIRIRARFDNMSMRAEPLYAAINISERDILRKSEVEREAFAKFIGQEVAAHALAQIMRHWRSR